MAYKGAKFTRLPLLTQTVYAQLIDRLLTAEAGDLSAGTSLVSKQIGSRKYWYAQRREDGKKIQTYIGPATPEIEALVERWRNARKEAMSRTDLVAMARAGGAYAVAAVEARVLQRLSDVFRMGAVLVGSHGFAVLGNLLGVRWQESLLRTSDVDIAHDRHIALAMSRDAAPIDLPALLGDAVPRIPVLHPTYPATTFRVGGTEIDVEILTPLVGKERKRPIRIEALGAAAVPLRFLDYLLEETQPGAVLGGEGVLVNVPRPGRFALHKLIVASRRLGGAQIAKTAKDRAQASALLAVLLEDAPEEIRIAWKALSTRGRSWIAAVATSVARLDPELIDALRAFGIKPR